MGGRKRVSPDEDGEVEQHREEHVHRRPGDDDDDPLPQRLRLEGALAILGEDRLLPVLLEHLHEAAEREDADAVLRLAAAEAEDLGAEADREGEDLDPEDLRPHEVAELVHEDEHRAEQGEVEQIHGPLFLAERAGAVPTIYRRAAAAAYTS